MSPVPSVIPSSPKPTHSLGYANPFRDAVRCHFDEGDRPKVIWLHLVRQEDPFASFEEWASEADTKGYASF